MEHITLQKVYDTFQEIKKDIPILCCKWGKSNGSQFLYGDVLDWIRDMHNDIYHSPYCETFARLIIGEYVISKKLL